MLFSALSAMVDIVLTASNGYKPLADSPESIIQQVPSNTALATSLTSALVGLGEAVMLSSIWVATTDSLPLLLHSSMIFF